MCLVCIREYGVGPVSRLWEADEAGQDVWGVSLRLEIKLLLRELLKHVREGPRVLRAVKDEAWIIVTWI